MLEKITPEQLVEKGVVSAPDKLKGNPQANKYVFDCLVAEVVAPIVNSCIDTVNSVELQEETIRQNEAERQEAEESRQQAEEERQALETGYVARAENAAVAAESSQKAAKQSEVAAAESARKAAQAAVGQIPDGSLEPVKFSESSKSMMVRENMLDNNCFIPGCVVNQRGQSEYTTAGFTIDRWRCYTAGASISITENGLSIKQAASTIGYAQLLQRMEPAVWNEIYGNNRTVTVSILRADGVLRTKTGKFSGFGTLTIHGGSYFRFTSAYQAFDMIILGDTCPDIVAVKLELGDTQTLAHQDAEGNWVLNEIPNYGQELAKCLRYFERIQGLAGYNIAIGVGSGRADTIWVPLRIHPKRAVPTLVLSGTFAYGLTSLSEGVATSVTIGAAVKPKHDILQIAVEGVFTAGAMYRVGLSGESYLDFSADL